MTDNKLTEDQGELVRKLVKDTMIMHLQICLGQDYKEVSERIDSYVEALGIKDWKKPR